MSIELVMKQIDGIESSMEAFQKKAEEEIKNAGKVGIDTQASIDKLGEQQREVADRLLALEQSGPQNQEGEATISMGRQFTDSDGYKNFIGGHQSKTRVEVQNNTSTGSDVTVAPDRKPGVVAGAFQPLSLENLFPSIPTTSNAIEFTREATFVNNAAETAEAGTKPESDITFELVNMPVSTVPHWTKISKQLAADAPALAAYINLRMVYGVNRRVETQLGAGNGTAPNLSGILDTGNFTAHGYADGDLGTVLKKLVLIRKMIADAHVNGFPADAILLNPVDCAQIDVDLFTSTSNATRFGVNSLGQPTLFGLPVFESVGMTADQVAVGAFKMAGTIHNRQGVVVELSESDGDNFIQNLITIRAERRLALTIEQPQAILAGDLTPAA